MQMENNIRQEEIPANQESLKPINFLWKKSVKSNISIETKNRYSPLETEESPTDNENTKPTHQTQK